MAAAKNKHSEVVDTLLKRGAEVDLARDVSSITIFHCTLGYSMKFFESQDGSTALHVASYYKGNSAVMNVLIKHGAMWTTRIRYTHLCNDNHVIMSALKY